MKTIVFYGRLLAAVIKARLGLLHAPFKYILVVTKACNSKCRNCLIWTEKVQNELSLEEYSRLAQLSPGLLWLNLTGGEVTLRADVVEIVRTFKRHCRHLEILNFTTNGIDPVQIAKTVREFKSIGFLKLTVNVSLDGPADVHDRLRGIRGNFLSAVQTFREIHEIGGVDCFFSFTIYDSNYESFEAMVAAVKEVLPDTTWHDFHLNLENRSEHFYRNEKLAKSLPSIAAREGKRNLLSQFLRHSPSRFIGPMDYFKNMYHRLAREFLLTGRTPIPCRALVNSIYISEHGDVLPCVVWNQKIGSLRESEFSVTEILNSDLGNQTRKNIAQKNCPNCWTPCEAYHSMLTSPVGLR